VIKKYKSQPLITKSHLHGFVAIFAVLLVQLTALVVSGYQSVLYERYVMPESLSNISQHDSRTAISTSYCGFDCLKREKCNGFTYDWLNKKCSVKTCVNPNLYPEGQEGDSDFYIRADVGGGFSKLLARSENINYLNLYLLELALNLFC